MANRERGEVSLTATKPDGTEKTYTLKWSFSGMCALEDALSTNGHEVKFTDVTDKASGGSMRALRHVVWAALQKYHATEFPDFASVNHVIDSDDLTEAMKNLLTSLSSDEDDAAELRPVNPRAARADRKRDKPGATSTSTPGESA